MAERGMYRPGRYPRRRGGTGDRTLTARLDRLLTLVAERRRLEAIERPLRTRVAAEMTARHQRGGADQFRRPGGLISLVMPRPTWDIFDQRAFTDWLVANGHSDLVTQRVVVTDHACLIALVGAPSRSGRVSQRKLTGCVAVVVEADAGAPELLDVKVGDDGGLRTLAGETIPGVRATIREPWVQVCAAASSERMDVVAGGGAPSDRFRQAPNSDLGEHTPQSRS